MKRVERNKGLKNVALKISIVYNNCNKPDITTTITQQILQRATSQILHQNIKLNPDLEFISQQFTNLDQWLNTNLNQWLNINLNQLVPSIIENHRLRSEEPKSTQTLGYNYRTTTTRQQASNATNKQASKATNKHANKATTNKSIEKVTTDIHVHIPLPHTPSFGATSSSLGHNLSPNSKPFSATTDNRQQARQLADNR
jgi:regulator of replication initiation timing